MPTSTLHKHIAARTPPDVAREAGSIPLEHAAICWERGNYNDLQVLDFRRINDPTTWEHRVWWRPLISTHGACFADWGINPRHTPLGMLAEMAFDGTLPQGDDLVRLLAQFAKIKGCDWARHMIAALRCGTMIINGEHVHFG